MEGQQVRVRPSQHIDNGSLFGAVQPPVGDDFVARFDIHIWRNLDPLAPWEHVGDRQRRWIGLLAIPRREQMLGSRLDHLDAQSEDLLEQIPL